MPYVVPNHNSGWDVKKGGGVRAIKHFDNKREAVVQARDISRKQSTELIIHGRNGKIQKSDSHGNDPFPPRGKTKKMLTKMTIT